MTNPYQEASEEVQRRGELPISMAKSLGGAIAGGAALKAVSKVLPFLNKHIPASLAIKGLTKADPRYGKFIQKSLAEGKPMDEIKDFIREKAESALPKEKAVEGKNIIEQYDPELHKYITEKIKKGSTHIHAGTKALKHERFKKAINKLTKDHKTSWDRILESVYGSEGMAQSRKEPQQEPQKEQIQQQQPQGGQRENGTAQQAIMQALQNAAQARQRRQKL